MPPGSNSETLSFVSIFKQHAKGESDKHVNIWIYDKIYLIIGEKESFLSHTLILKHLLAMKKLNFIEKLQDFASLFRFSNLNEFLKFNDEEFSQPLQDCIASVSVFDDSRVISYTGD